MSTMTEFGMSAGSAWLQSSRFRRPLTSYKAGTGGTKVEQRKAKQDKRLMGVPSDFVPVFRGKTVAR